MYEIISAIIILSLSEYVCLCDNANTLDPLADSLDILYRRWPSHCCQLSLTKWDYKSNFPKDYIQSSYKGVDFTYGINCGHLFVTGEPTSDFAPIKNVALDPFCNPLKSTGKFFIITNPLNCSVSWIKLRHQHQDFKSVDGYLTPDERIFYPAIKSNYIARYLWENETLPAFHKNDLTQVCWKYTDSENESRRDRVTLDSSADHEILAVNCDISLDTIKAPYTVNVTIEASDKADEILSEPKQLFMYSHNNDGYEAKKVEIVNEVGEKKSIELTTNKQVIQEICEEKKIMFENRNEVKLTFDSIFSPLGAPKAEITIEIALKYEQETKKCNTTTESNTKKWSFEKNSLHSHKQNIILPSFTIGNIYTNISQFHGTIEYTVNITRLYENEKVEKTILEALKKFRPQNLVQKHKGRGIVFRYFDTATVTYKYVLSSNLIVTKIPKHKHTHHPVQWQWWWPPLWE